MTPEEGRWYEVLIYNVFTNSLKLQQDFNSIMHIVNALSPIGNYNTEHLKITINELISSIRCRPDNAEYVLLLRKRDIPIRTIHELTGMCNRTIYKIIKDNETDPRPIYNKLTLQQDELLKKFAETLHKVKEILPDGC